MGLCDGKGQDKVKELLKSFFAELRYSGFCTWAIAHTKDKVIKEKGMTDDDAYQKLTSNLSNSYESIFGDIFDCVLTGVVDKDVKDGRITSSVRKLVFRDDGYVEAGCRFGGNAIPQYIVCPDDAKEFAKLVVETLKNGLKNTRNESITDEEFAKLEKKEIKEFVNTKAEVETEPEVEINNVTEETFDKEAALKMIRNNVKKPGVADLSKKLLAEEQVKVMGDLSEEAIKEIIALI